ncbi:MAG: hypothetical protein ACR2JK_03365 [Geodermatophilaceae bacterium]
MTEETSGDVRPVEGVVLRAFRDDGDFARLAEIMNQSWALMPFWDDTLRQVAWHGDEPVGLVLNFIRANENARFGRLRG